MKTFIQWWEDRQHARKIARQKADALALVGRLTRTGHISLAQKGQLIRGINERTWWTE